jgi:hypothetical protein
MRFLKLAVLAVGALTCGCAANGRLVLSPPLEQRPSNDALWMPVGAVGDAWLQAAHVQAVPRAALVILGGMAVRYTTVVHRPADSGVDIVFGASVSELLGFAWRGLHQKRSASHR